MRRMRVTNKKYSANNPTYIQIQVFTANEELNQVAYVNYTSNEFNELSYILEDFLFVDTYKAQ